MFAPLPPWLSRACPLWWKSPLVLAPLRKLPRLGTLTLTVLMPPRARASMCSQARSLGCSLQPAVAQQV